MNLDIKIPMGLFFVITGIILVIYGGWISDPVIYDQRSLGYNINLYWGGVLVVFGMVSLFLKNKRSN